MSAKRLLQVLTFGWLFLIASVTLAAYQVPILIHAKSSIYTFNVEIADTADERALGLMNRTHLDSNQGMLFLYPAANPVSFWMKNTPLSLDMLFIDADGRIVNVAARTKPFDVTPINSAGPVIAVLEIIGGSAEKLGIKAGDKVEWPVQTTKPEP